MIAVNICVMFIGLVTLRDPSRPSSCAPCLDQWCPSYMEETSWMSTTHLDPDCGRLLTSYDLPDKYD